MRDFRTLNISEIIIEKISHGLTLIDTDKMSFKYESIVSSFIQKSVFYQCESVAKISTYPL